MQRDYMDQLEERTKQFAIAVIRFCIVLQRHDGLRRLADQLVDSAGSVAANHRAMRRARSPREFAAKTHIVLEEVDESVLWLEIAAAIEPAHSDTRVLLSEARELRAIFARSYATARRRVPQTRRH
jgi:four helix bundle protein